jgi:hypothetical protein
MSTITHAQVQELVTQLPEEQLAAAHGLLLRLIKQRKHKEVKEFSDRGQAAVDAPNARQSHATVMTSIDFMQLPLRERRQLMKKQAAYMAEYYEQTTTEREGWQAGEFVDDPAG